ncbi:MAG: DUF58 domain-containing protein [Ruminococcus sp.]|nr:DUF58 domain-containing protein [Ruminococcus sp.]
MILMKILFLLLILICAVFYIMYLWDFALVLLAVMIAVPAVMFVTTLIAKRSMTAELVLPGDTAQKNESFPVQLRIHSRSPFPIGKAEARIEYYNVFNNQINEFELFMPVQASNSQSVAFRLSSKYCGIVNIRCKEIYIYDPLRIFRFRAAEDICTEIAVMPESREVSGRISYSDRVSEESTVFSEHKPGDDPSEVFDLRGYNPGDRLNRIHWKLSSKKDEFIVKDYSLPVDIPAILFLDLKCYEDSSYTLPVFDTLIETLISLSQFMLENERLHTIAYFSGKTGRFTEVQITGNDSLSACIRDMILSITDNLYCEPPEVYLMDRNDTTGFSLSSFTMITSSHGTAVLEYIDENVDADICNAVVVVKSPEETVSSDGLYSELNVIPVVIGRISGSIRDIEL